MLYTVTYGDSPAIIARRYGVTMASLVSANPQKPTTVVAGVRTWRDLRLGETVSVPVGGFVGDAATDAVSALVAAGGPCVQANAGWVCLVQKALGVAADGKWGSDTSTAARARVPGAPAACSPRPSWWAPAGQVNCPAVLPTLPPAPAPAPTPPAPTVIPSIPSIPGIPTCAPGTVFNPLTGQCEALVVPYAPPAPAPAVVPPPAPPPVTPVSITCPAGTMLNPMTGNCEAIPPIPPLPAPPLPAPPPPAPAPSMACPPGQVWNSLTGQCETPIVQCPPGQTLDPATGQCLAAALPPLPAPSPAPVPAPAPAPAPAPTPGPSQQVVTAPTKPALSTGTIVAGAVGAVALVGVIAAASMSGGKKSNRRRR